MLELWVLDFERAGSDVVPGFGERGSKWHDPRFC